MKKKIKELIEQSDSILPVYPSAQMWFKKFDDEDREDLQKVVEDTGYKWKKYDREMRAHWPQSVPDKRTPTYRVRKAK
jgi:hypothetical protein